MENMSYAIVALAVVLEYLEISWQRGRTFKEMIVFNFIIYQNGIFAYLFRHVSFIYMVFVVVYFGAYNMSAFALLTMKFFDIALKLHFINNLDKQGEKYLATMLSGRDFLLTPFYRYLNTLAYPAVLYLAIG